MDPALAAAQERVCRIALAAGVVSAAHAEAPPLSPARPLEVDARVARMMAAAAAASASHVPEEVQRCTSCESAL